MVVVLYFLVWKKKLVGWFGFKCLGKYISS